MDKHSKILVAGATGLVGSAIIRQLLKNGYTNIIGTYKNKNPEKIYKDFKKYIEKGYLKFIQVDLIDQIKTKILFESVKPEYVFLAAAKVGGIWANNIYRADFIYQNLQIQNNVIHFSYKYDVKKLLFLGSTCIYPRNCPQPMKEEYLLSGILEYTNEPYAIAKISGLKMCESYNIQYETNFISVMPTNLYGFWDNFDLETSHVIPGLIRKIHLAKCLEESNWDEIKKDLNLRPLEGISGNALRSDILKILEKYGVKKSNDIVKVEIWGTGKPKREFLWADDLADACIFLMKNINFKDIVSLIYPDLSNIHSYKLLDLIKDGKEIRNTHINVGTGEEISIKELAYLIKKIVGFEGELYFNPKKPDGTPRKVTDISRIRQLGWKHKVSLREGLKKLYEWYIKSYC
ncbi:MAG TPA: GDP-L-fucose synthase [Hydrogenothermaceae bacterium]|nr:GDP-L-fucose synthase [Hydrogenothermaceae bacterium]